MTYPVKNCRQIAATLVSVLVCLMAAGQDHDSSYYDAYPNDVVARVFLSQKYTALELKKGNDPPRLRYLPNTDMSLGLGLTYRRATLNLAYGFNFLNKEEEKGSNKKLDLQTRLYVNKWAIDLYGQFYKGYYVIPKGRGHLDAGSFYTRPDLHVNLVGLSAYRVLNNRRFTLRPLFMQDDFQKRSAGSFLIGGEAYYGSIKADSAIVPSELSLFYDRRNIDRTRMFQLGVGIGYAQTLVLPLHLFLTGSFVVGPNLSYVQESGMDKTNHLGVNANWQYRIGGGYTNGTWNINALWINSRNGSSGAKSGNTYILNTGNVRFTVARRLTPGRGAKKLLKPVDYIFNMIDRLK